MTIFLIVFLIALILCSAFFSASETALFSLSPLTLKTYQTSPDPRLNGLANMMRRPRDVLVTVLILNIAANLLIQNTVSSLFGSALNWLLKVGVPLALTLIFGEVIPKSIAISTNTVVAYRTAPLIQAMIRFLRPIRNPLTKATVWISRFLFFFLQKEREIFPDELRHVLKTSKESGVLLPQECSLIGGLLDLQQLTVSERMRPREEILFYSIHESLDKLVHLFVDLEISRVPICDKHLDLLFGVLSARRFFFHKDRIKTSADLISILKKPYYVPESTKCWALLGNLRERGESLAIVVDEYGAVSGLVSQEDLIEMVVGEIADRRDSKALYTRSSDDAVIASGKLELSDFQEIFGISLKSKENRVTLGGWLIEQLGDIPVAGTKYANDQFLFYILAADLNRIRRVYIRKLGGAKS